VKPGRTEHSRTGHLVGLWGSELGHRVSVLKTCAVPKLVHRRRPGVSRSLGRPVVFADQPADDLVGAENLVIATDLVFRVVRGPSKLDIWLRDSGGIGHFSSHIATALLHGAAPRVRLARPVQPRQGRRDPHPAPSGRRAPAPGQDTEAVVSRPGDPGRAVPATARRSSQPVAPNHLPSYPAALARRPGQAEMDLPARRQDGHVRRRPSGRWCWRWRGITQAGDIGVSTAIPCSCAVCTCCSSSVRQQTSGGRKHVAATSRHGWRYQHQPHRRLTALCRGGMGFKSAAQADTFRGPSSLVPAPE
jgi:hypothetical protein